jgi:CPA1 family monovalent cation:H+ antiporter
LLRRTRERVPWSWSIILTWGGLRGGLPMVLVLSLPQQFPHRELLVTMTFGVVLISILVHGMTVSPLLHRLGIVEKQAERKAYEFMRGKIQAIQAALKELNNMSSVRFVSRRILSNLQKDYEERIEKAEKRINDLHLDQQQIHGEELQWAHRHLLLTEKNQVIDSFHQGILSQDVYEKLLADIDTRLLRLETDESDGSEM